MSLNIFQSHHGTPHSKSSQGTQKTGQSARVSHRVLQGPAPMLPGLTSYCFSSPFTPATEASLLIRHAAQIVRNLHSSTPSLLNTLPLLAKPLISFKFSLKHHLVIKAHSNLPISFPPVLVKTHHIQILSIFYLLVMFLDYCLLLEYEPHKERNCILVLVTNMSEALKTMASTQ